MLMSAGTVMGGEKAAGTAGDGQKFSEDLFQNGRYEATLTSGVLFSPLIAEKSRPTFNYTMTGFQLGYMLSDVKGAEWLRGNVEVAGEGFGSAVFKGCGGYVAGMTGWLRYNFVPQRCRMVPFAQGGAGVTFTDIDHHVVGETFNFNLDLGAGVRCFVARNWSVNLELRYQHISNAHLNPVNLGINSYGPILGVSYFF